MPAQKTAQQRKLRLPYTETEPETILSPRDFDEKEIFWL